MIKKLAIVLVVVALSIVQRSIVLRGDKGLIICLIFASPIQPHPIALSVVWTFVDALLGCLCLLYNCSFVLEQLVCSRFLSYPSRPLDNGFLTLSPIMLSFVHLGLQIFVGLLIARIVHCRGKNIPIGVLRHMHHLIATAFQTCCCYVGGLEKE